MNKKRLLSFCLLILLLSISLLTAACTKAGKIERIEVYIDGSLVETSDVALTVTYGDTVDLANRVRVKTIAKNGDVTELSADSPEYTILNVPDVFDVGTYNLEVKYGEMSSVSFTLSVVPKKVTKPSGTRIFNFTGAEQTFTPDGFDGDTMTIVGNTATSCGSNTATVTLTDSKNYSWADGTNSAVELEWSIAKGTPQYTVPQGLTAHVGDTLSAVTLPTADNGVWSWTDGSLSVGAKGRNTHSAIFTPTDTTNYNVVTDLDVVVSVSLDSYTNITYPAITDRTYNPDFTLADFPLHSNFRWADSTIVPTCDVTEYRAIYNANSVYYNDFELTITITLAKAEYNGITHTALSGTYNPNKTLTDYTLTNGFTWADSTIVPTCDVTEYDAIYNADPDNYNSFNAKVTLTLAKAEYDGITHSALSGTYNPNKTLADYSLSADYSWADSTIVPTCDVTEYRAIYNANSVYYNDFELTITITLAKAEYDGITHSALSGTYDPNKTLADYSLSADYSWADNTIVPTCDVTEYDAIYNTDSVNYKNFELKVTLTLAKAEYNGITHTALSGTYNPNKTLADYTLTNGFTWADSTIVPTCNVTEYDAIYNADPDDYNSFNAKVTLTLAKAEYDGITHTALSGTYDPNKTLVDYSLSADYSWADNTIVPTCDVTEYDAIYNTDSVNYKNFEIKVTLMLAKAEYDGITHTELSSTYDPNKTLADYLLNDYFSWVDNTIVPTCDVTEYDAVYNADSTNYNDFELVIEFNLFKYTPSYTLPTNLTGISGKTLSTVTLPSATNGVWSWNDGNTVLSDDGSTYSATFTPTDTVNYNAIYGNVQIDVSQLTLTTINGTITGSEDTNASYDYNTSVSVTSETITEGYYFVGWQKNGSTVSTETTYSFNITESVTLSAVIEEIAVTAIEPFTAFPVKNYRLNAPLNTSGMKILVSYNYGIDEVENVLDLYVSGFDTSTAGNEKTATITYEGKTCTFTYNVVPPVLQSIELHLVSWNDFSIGDSYRELDDNETPDDPTDDTWYYAIVLLLIYDYDIDSELYPSRVDITEAPEGFSTERVGQFSITVNYGEKSCLYTYTVFPKSVNVPGFMSIEYGTLLSELNIAYYDQEEYTWAWKDDTATVGDVGINYHTATCTFTADGSTLDYAVQILVRHAPTPDSWYADAPTGLTATYGQTLGDVDVSAFNNEHGTWVWQGTDLSFQQVCTLNLGILFVPNNKNYKEVNVRVVIVVGKADLPDELVPIVNVFSNYGAKLSNASFSNFSDLGTFVWNEVNPAGETYVGDIGKNTFKADFTHKDGYYNTKVIDVIVEVRAANLAVPTGTEMPSLSGILNAYEKSDLLYGATLWGGIVKDGYGEVVEGTWTVDQTIGYVMRDSGITFTPTNTTRYKVLKTTFDAAVSNFYKAITVDIVRGAGVEFYYGEQGSRQLMMFGDGLIKVTYEGGFVSTIYYTKDDVIPSGADTYLNAATPNYAVKFTDDVKSLGRDVPRGALITTEQELIDAIALTDDESVDSTRVIAFVDAYVTLTANIATNYHKELIIADGATLDLDEFVISYSEYITSNAITVFGTLTSNHGDSVSESIVNLFHLTNSGNVNLKQIGTEESNYWIENTDMLAILTVDTLVCKSYGGIINYGTINVSENFFASDITNSGTINALKNGVTIADGGSIDFYVNANLNGEMHLTNPMSPVTFNVYNSNELAKALTYSNNHLGNSNVHILIQNNIDLTGDDRFVDYDSTDDGIKLLIHADNNGGTMSNANSLYIAPSGSLNLGGKKLGLDFIASLSDSSGVVTMDQTRLASIENEGTISNGYIVYNVDKCHNTLTKGDFLLGSGTYPADEFISEGGGNTLYAKSSNQLERALAFDGFAGKSITVVMSADAIGATEFTYANATNNHILPAGFELVLKGIEWKTANTGYKATITLSDAEGELPAAKIRLLDGAKIVNTDFIVEEIDATSLITVDATSSFGEDGNLNSIQLSATAANISLDVLDGSCNFATPIIDVPVASETELNDVVTAGYNIPNSKITATLTADVALTDPRDLGTIQLIIPAGFTLNGRTFILYAKATEDSVDGVPIKNYGALENIGIFNCEVLDNYGQTVYGVAVQRSYWTSFGGTFSNVYLYNNISATSNITNPSAITSTMANYVGWSDGLIATCNYDTNGFDLISMGNATFKAGMILVISGDSYINNGTYSLTFEYINSNFYAFIENYSTAAIGITSVIVSTDAVNHPKDRICTLDGVYDVSFVANMSVTDSNLLMDALSMATSNPSDIYTLSIADNITLFNNVTIPENVQLSVASGNTLNMNGYTVTFSNPKPASNLSYFPTSKFANNGTITNGNLVNNGFAYGLFRYEGTYSNVTLTQSATLSNYDGGTLDSKLLQRSAFFDAGSYAGTTSNGLKAYINMVVDIDAIVVFDFSLNAGATLTVNDNCSLTPFSDSIKITFGYEIDEIDAYAGSIVNNATTSGGVSGFIVELTHMNQTTTTADEKCKVLSGEGIYSNITANYVYTAMNQNFFVNGSSQLDFEQTTPRPDYVTFGTAKIIVAASFETVFALPAFYSDIEINAGVTLTFSESAEMSGYTITLLSDGESYGKIALAAGTEGYPVTLSNCNIIGNNITLEQAVTLGNEYSRIDTETVTFNGIYTVFTEAELIAAVNAANVCLATTSSVSRRYTILIDCANIGTNTITLAMTDAEDKTLTLSYGIDVTLRAYRDSDNKDRYVNLIVPGDVTLNFGNNKLNFATNGTAQTTSKIMNYGTVKNAVISAEGTNYVLFRRANVLQGTGTYENVLFNLGASVKNASGINSATANMLGYAATAKAGIIDTYRINIIESCTYGSSDASMDLSNAAMFSDGQYAPALTYVVKDGVTFTCSKNINLNGAKIVGETANSKIVISNGYSITTTTEASNFYATDTASTAMDSATAGTYSWNVEIQGWVLDVA